MSFVSLKFLCFFAAAAAVYFISPKKIKWMVLLAASYIFYIISAGIAVLYIVFTTVTCFLGGSLMRRVTKAEPELSASENRKRNRTRKRIVLSIVSVLNFGILCLVKYFTNFSIFRTDDLLIPLGISFYTFQSIGYVVDVYRNKIEPERNIFKFALFISFFPQVVQGPIGRYKELSSQLSEPHGFDYDRVKSGALLFLWGVFKKMIIADRISVMVKTLFGDNPQYTGAFMALGALGYAIRIFADFSGGIDIARGFAEILGINLEENFTRPYLSVSIAEYWRRWHITLGAWCRDYIFYPLSLSKIFARLGKGARRIFGTYIGKLMPVLLAQMIVFLIIGIWHGASFKNAAFGLYYGFFIVMGIALEPVFIKITSLLKIPPNAWWFRVFRIIRTFIITTFARFFSAAGSFRAALSCIKRLFNPAGWRELSYDALLKLGLDEPNFILLLVCIGLLIAADIIQENGIRIRNLVQKSPLPVRWAFYMTALLAVTLFGIYGYGADASGFIYRGF